MKVKSFLVYMKIYLQFVRKRLSKLIQAETDLRWAGVGWMPQTSGI